MLKNHHDSNPQPSVFTASHYLPELMSWRFNFVPKRNSLFVFYIRFKNHLNYPGIEPTSYRLHWVKILFVFSDFTLLNINTQKSIKSWTHNLKTSTLVSPAELTGGREQRVSQRFSLLLLSSNFIKSQDSNPQPPDQLIRDLNVLFWASASFIWRAVFEAQTDSRTELTVSELPDSPPAHWATCCRCVKLSFSLCSDRLSLSVCVSIRSLPGPNTSSTAARCIRTSPCCSGIQLRTPPTSPRSERSHKTDGFSKHTIAHMC